MSTLRCLFLAVILVTFVAGPVCADAPAEYKDIYLAKWIVEIRDATAKYQDIHRAKADGYVQLTGNVPLEGYHFYNAAITDLDVTRPSVLLYVRRGSRWDLVGVEYALPGSKPAESPFGGIPWARHEATCRYADWREVAAPVSEKCPDVHPETRASLISWNPDRWVIRLWLWYPNPAGLFAPLNPLLSPWDDRSLPPGGFMSWEAWKADIAFSVLNHNVSGWLVLIIGAALLLGGTGSTPLVRLAPFGMLLAIPIGFLIILRPGLDVWPYGATLLDSLRQREYVEHTISAVLIISLGTVEFLRARNILRHRVWEFFLPVLALIAGTMLFFHVHAVSNYNYLGRQNLPHVTEGLTALALAALCILERKKILKGKGWGLAWPALVVAVGLQLILYVE